MTPDEHIDAFIDAFVHRHYRARLRLKHDDFMDALHHTLPLKLDPRFLVPLTTLKPTASLAGFLKTQTDSATAFLLGYRPDYEMRDYPLADALAIVDFDGSAIGVLEPGELAYYKDEPCFGAHGLDAGRYLLIHDPSRKAAIVKSIAALARTAQRHRH